MSSARSAVPYALPATPGWIGGRRALLLASTLAALGLTAGLGTSAAVPDLAPDLVRLLRFMAALKGVFAGLALAASFWRLARPAALWREVIYVAGPGLMAGGAVCLWQLHSAGIAAAVLHLGLFALLGAGLTDEAFIPSLARRRA